MSEEPKDQNEGDDNSFLDILKNNKPEECNGHRIQEINGSNVENGEKVTYV